MLQPDRQLFERAFGQKLAIQIADQPGRANDGARRSDLGEHASSVSQRLVLEFEDLALKLTTDESQQSSYSLDRLARPMDRRAEVCLRVEETRRGRLQLLHCDALEPGSEWLCPAQLECRVEGRHALAGRRIGGQSGHMASVMSRTMRSAGLLPYRLASELEVMLAHPGGPFFAGKDSGAWSIVKGVVERGEADKAAAAREFEEETGWQPPLEGWVPLGETVLRSRKVVVAWAIDRDFDPLDLEPGMFTMYGRQYPEIDKVEWMTPRIARAKLNPAQTVFIDRLESHLGLNRSKT